MLQKIKLKHGLIVTMNYGIVVMDDPAFAETEIYILCSIGQDGGATLTVVTMAIDGGIIDLPSLTFHLEYGKMRHEEVPKRIIESLELIRSHFKTEDEFLCKEDIHTICKAWDKLYH